MGVFDKLSGLVGGGDAGEATEAPADSEADAAGDGAADDAVDPADLTPDEYRERADALAGRSDVPTLDYTVESLDRLDELAGGPYSPVDDEVAYGSYLGETLARAYAGRWVSDDGPAVAVPLADDETTVAVFDAGAMAVRNEPVFAKIAQKLEDGGAEATPPAEREERPPDDGADVAADDESDGDADPTATDDDGEGEGGVEEADDGGADEPDDTETADDEPAGEPGDDEAESVGEPDAGSDGESPADDETADSAADEIEGDDENADDGDDAAGADGDEPFADQVGAGPETGDGAGAMDEGEAAGAVGEDDATSETATADRLPDDSGPTEPDRQEPGPKELGPEELGPEEPVTAGAADVDPSGDGSTDESAGASADPDDPTTAEPDARAQTDGEPAGEDAPEPVDGSGEATAEEAPADDAPDDPASRDGEGDHAVPGDDAVGDQGHDADPSDAADAADGDEADRVADERATRAEDERDVRDGSRVPGPVPDPDGRDAVGAVGEAVGSADDVGDAPVVDDGADEAAGDEAPDDGPLDDEPTAGDAAGDLTGSEVADDPAAPATDEHPRPPDQRALRATAEAFAEAWTDHDLDVTPASLPRLDRFVDRQWAGRFDRVDLSGRAVEPGPDADALTQVGAYYGEVLARWLGGEWARTDGGEPGVEVEGVGERSEVVAVFDEARECLRRPATFAYRYDALLNRLEREEHPISDGRAALTVPGADAEADAGSPSTADVITAVAADADEFAASWPDYRLGYSPRSLARLDTLVEREFGAHDVDEVPLEEPTDAASLFLTARTADAGAYFATVLVRHLDAQWRIDGDVTLVVDGPGETATVTPFETARECIRRDASFAARYEALRERHRVDAPTVREQVE